MKKNFKVISTVIIAILLIIATLIFNKDRILKVFTSEIISDNNEDSKVIDLSKIKELQQSKDLKPMSYDDVISLLGDGTVSYPNPDNKAVKVVYWEFNNDGYQYFLDAIFFNDEFVNMESRLVEFPSTFEKANIENFSEIEDEINTLTRLSELESIVGKGVKVMQYYTEENQAIYAWSYEDGFLVAYISNDDKIIYVKTAETLDALVSSSTNCH